MSISTLSFATNVWFGRLENKVTLCAISGSFYWSIKRGVLVCASRRLALAELLFGRSKKERKWLSRVPTMRIKDFPVRFHDTVLSIPGTAEKIGQIFRLPERCPWMIRNYKCWYGSWNSAKLSGKDKSWASMEGMSFEKRTSKFSKRRYGILILLW